MKVSARRRKGYAHSLTYAHHTLIADEPPDHGGTDTGPTPTAMLAMSLAACTAITLEMYAERKGWDLGDVEVEVDYEREGDASTFEVAITIPSELSSEEEQRLQEIAGRCPVHRTLAGEVEITDRIVNSPPPANP